MSSDKNKGEARTQELKASALFNVEGHVALVTGGGTGIGLMIAQALAANGAKVYITGRRKDALQRAADAHSASSSGGGSLIPITCDIRSKDDIAKLRDEIASKEDHLNLLVNNAGVAGETRNTDLSSESADKLSEELWKDTFDMWQNVYATNVTSYYFTSVAFLPLLSRATKHNQGESGAIINICSISGILTSSQHHLAYNASKAGTIHLTKLLAGEFSQGAIKVRVNSIAPGIFPSEMTGDGSDDKQKTELSSEGYRDQKGIPAGRPGRDNDMAQIALTLACNQYMNGSVVVVDGGYLLKNP